MLLQRPYALRAALLFGLLLDMDKFTCKHSTSRHRDDCLLGIKYKSVTVDPDKPGCAFREACRLPESWHSPEYVEKARHQERGVCEHFCLPTDAEVADYEAEVQRHIKKVTTAANYVHKLKQEHKGKDWSGVVECPVCGGKLHVGIAGSYNGHASVSCETTDCVRYRE